MLETTRASYLLRLAAVYEFLAWAVLVGLGLSSLAAGGVWIWGAFQGPADYRTGTLLLAAFILALGLGLAAGLFALLRTAAGVTRELALLVPQRLDRVEQGRGAGGVEAEEHADRG